MCFVKNTKLFKKKKSSVLFVVCCSQLSATIIYYPSFLPHAEALSSGDNPLAPDTRLVLVVFLLNVVRGEMMDDCECRRVLNQNP